MQSNNTNTQEAQEKTNLVQSEMIQAAFDFWFKDHDHIRSPFPEYIREPLRMKTLDKFFDWINNISERAKKDINDEIVAEKFEEILFEEAATIVLTEDEKLTILYPFMPRIDDVIKPKGQDEESKVISRSHLKQGDHAFLKVKLEVVTSGKIWETDFELPE